MSGGRARGPGPIRRLRTAGWGALLPESRRTLLSWILPLPVVLPWWGAAELRHDVSVDGRVAYLLLFVALQMLAYASLTLIAFGRVDPARLERWAHWEQPERRWQRWAGLESSGPVSLATSVASVALIGGVLWLPSRGLGIHVPGLNPVTVTVLLLASAWVSVAVTFAVAYLRADLRSGHRALDFPGDEPREASDYLYLALALSTTFGTTDVEVREAATRRRVAAHSVVAFAFNTIILAGVVSILVSALSR